MPETTTFTPQKLFAGDNPPPLTKPVTILDGETLAQFEVVMSDAAGKMVAHAGFTVDGNATPVDTTGKVAGIMMALAAPSGSDGVGSVWYSGCFFASELIWPSGVNTDLLKFKLVENSDIAVVFQDAGEV